jgi:heme A synthase
MDETFKEYGKLVVTCAGLIALVSAIVFGDFAISVNIGWTYGHSYAILVLTGFLYAWYRVMRGREKNRQAMANAPDGWQNPKMADEAKLKAEADAERHRCGT